MMITGATITSNIAEGAMANEGGGGVFNAGGTITIDSSVIALNTATGTAGSGGGILNDGGTLTVMNSTISENTSMRAGGGIEDNSVEGNLLTLTNINLSDNVTGSAPGNGGGLHITGPGNSIITGSVVSSNSAAREGGGLWNGSGLMTITSTEIINNVALGDGADDGGAGIFNNGGDLILENGNAITGNIASGTSASGGGILSLSGDLTIVGSEINNNSANRAGGAIEIIDGSLTFDNSMMVGNDVAGGAGTPAPGNGGGLHITGNDAFVTISNSIIAENEGGREGGGLWNQSGSTMLVMMSTIEGNTSFGDGADDGGAGLFNNGGILMLSNSAVINNVDNGMESRGAGIHNHATGTVEIAVSTISGNRSNFGGGVFNGGDTVWLNAVTIANNEASMLGGGIYSDSMTMIKNTLIANNSGNTGIDISGNVRSEGYNLIGMDDEESFEQQETDLVNVDPMLAELNADGQATATLQLMTGSPAYNAGDPDDMFEDQNSQEVFGGRRDIGAAEAQAVLTSLDEINFEASGIHVYPVPVKDFINIVIPSEFGSDTGVMIYEVGSGRKVSQMKLSNHSSRLNLSNLNEGVYFIKIYNEEKYVNKSFIKLKG
jgi:hypothetical protein